MHLGEKGGGMRKFFVLAVLMAALATPAAVVAANLSKGIGSSCPNGTVGAWHFVNNQTDGASASTIAVIFDLADFGVVPFGPIAPVSVSRNNQQFYVYTNNGARLLGASTTLPGKLVLQDFVCLPPA
jgi:hypothetical protein